VELARVGLKYSGLRPWEIWLSEAQERMVIAVPSQHLDDLAEICQQFDVEWDDIGRITGDRQMVVKYDGKPVVDLPMALLHDSHPQLQLDAEWQQTFTEPFTDQETLDRIDPVQALLALLADPDVASKEAVIRTYDHEVRAGTVVKPLTGIKNHGPSDAAVLKPLGTNTLKGVAVSNGINPRVGLVDPYAMALCVVDEAIRNAVAVGADPDQLAILDNFCWGNPNLPDRLGALVRAAKGCHDAARAFDVPFISGKDSLNNEYVDRTGERTPIPGTLLVSAIAIVPDIRQAVTMDLKTPDDLLYIVGETRDELGGSLLAAHFDFKSGQVPGLPRHPLQTVRQLHQAIKLGTVRACHDLSEGGLAVAAAEMALAGGLGLMLDVAAVPVGPDACHLLITLFSESNGRWLVEVPPAQATFFESLLDGCVFSKIGKVIEEPQLQFGSIEIPVKPLEQAWRGDQP
jgi:phosphoribosylformylglycinamidine synthase